MEDHPVWSLYDFYRDVRLNVKYYSARYAIWNRNNYWAEIILAIAAPGSGVAAYFETSLWKPLAVIASVIAIIKPLSKISDSAGKYYEIATDWRCLEHATEALVLEVKNGKVYDADLQSRFLNLHSWKGEILKKVPTEKESARLIEKYYEEVNRELPADSFIIPANK